jgi:Zn-dependent protease with chaperone function
VGALIVLALFPVFVVALVLLLVVGGGYLAVKTTASVGSHVMVLAIPVLLAVGAGVRDVIRARRPDPAPGPALERAEHPALWAELDYLARSMGQDRPDRVVVHPGVNAAVTVAAGQREVIIGYPLLAGLTRLQLRAVLAHEMGHLAHGHAKSVGLSYRAGALLEQTVNRLDHALMRQIVGAYYRLYLLISMSVLRDHEREADDWSARLAGGPESATTFPAMARLDAVWTLLTGGYLPLALQIGARPPLHEAMEELASARKDRLDEYVDEDLRRPPSRWSTHPRPAERMQRLERAPGADALPAGSALSGGHEPAWYLLGRHTSGHLDPGTGGRALVALEAELLPDGAEPATWAQVVDRAMYEDARGETATLAHQISERLPTVPLTLHGILRTLAEPDTRRTVLTPLLRGDLPSARREEILPEAAAHLANAAVLVALSAAGRARTGLRWDGPAQPEFVDADGAGQPWPEQFELTAPVTRERVYEVLEAISGTGVDVEVPLDLTPPARAGAAEPSRAPRSLVTAAVPVVRVRPRLTGASGRTRHDVVVMDDGLLFVPVTGVRYGVLAAVQAQYLPGSLARKAGARLEALFDAVDGDPQRFSAASAAAPGRGGAAVWLPWSTVTHGTGNGARGTVTGKKLRLTLADGSVMKITWTTYTTELGPVWETLNAALDGRWGKVR